MERRRPLRADPEKIRTWQQESRARTNLARNGSPRRAPLRRTGFGKRGNGTKPRSRIQLPADPPPVVAELLVWGIRLKPGPCRACGREATDLHHAVPRSLSRAGRADLRNGLPLCHPCHVAWHSGTPIPRTAFTAEEWDFVTTLIGPGWLGRRYPRLRE